VHSVQGLSVRRIPGRAGMSCDKQAGGFALEAARAPR
jgi:hypothetical protein